MLLPSEAASGDFTSIIYKRRVARRGSPSFICYSTFYIESFRVVSIGVLEVSGTVVDGDDIVSGVAGADILVESELVVLALFAQLVKNILVDTKAAHAAAVFNNCLVFFMCEYFNEVTKSPHDAKSVPVLKSSVTAVSN